MAINLIKISDLAIIKKGKENFSLPDLFDFNHFITLRFVYDLDQQILFLPVHQQNLQ